MMLFGFPVFHKLVFMISKYVFTTRTNYINTVVNTISCHALSSSFPAVTQVYLL